MIHGEPGEPVDDFRQALTSTSVPTERVVLPHLELAARFDSCVDKLATMSGHQESFRTQEHYVDLMVGLSNAATAMRAVVTDHPDEAVSSLRAAIEHLQRVDTTRMTFPEDSAWSPGYP